jgi:hypothetical protein
MGAAAGAGIGSVVRGSALANWTTSICRGAGGGMISVVRGGIQSFGGGVQSGHEGAVRVRDALPTRSGTRLESGSACSVSARSSASRA